jgi:hypothetical protein
MRDSATPTRDAPLRRLALLGLVFVAVVLSCSKDVTGPGGGRFMRGFSWNPVFPAALRSVGVASSGIVDFNRVHVVLHHTDGTIALDTTVTFPASDDSLIVKLDVRLLADAPSSGEPMTVDLGYLDAAGDTVFKGGPISLVATVPSGGGTTAPVQVPVAYTGPGASATVVAITPHNPSVVAGGTFALTAAAKDAGGTVLAGTPVVWTSLDTTIAKITAPAAGAGTTLNVRGTARIVAQLLTGPADTAQVLVTLPASQIAKPATASGDAQTGTAGAALAQPIVAKVAASDGVGVAGTTVTFAVASGGGSLSPLTAVSDANGLAQTTWTLGTGAGAQSVTATAAPLTGSPLTYTATATAAAASKLAITSQPAGAAAGAAFAPIVVTAQDANGNVATSFTGNVALTIGTNPGTATLGGTVSVAAVAGVATFSNITLNKVGTGYTLVASSGSLASATSNGFAVTAGSAATLAFTVPPASTTAGTAIAPVVVTAQDANGNVATGFTGNVALAIGSNPGAATLGGTVSVAAVAGVATFSTLSLNKVGAGYTLVASSGSLASATSNGFAITAGAAGTLAFTAQPASTSAGATLATITVAAQDANGNVVTTYTGAVTVALGVTTSGAVLGGTTTVNAVAGVASFTTLSVNKNFTGYTLVASASGLTSATSSTFDIATGLATTFAVTGGNGQTGTVGVALPTPITVRATDAGGNGVAGKTVTFATTNGSVAPTSAVTDANGLAATTWTLGATVGSQSMTATSAGLANSPLTITATGIPGAATHLIFTTPPSGAAAGAANTPAIVVQALDANSLIASGFSGNVALAIGTNPGGSAIGGTLSVAAVAGVATFSNIVLNKVGTGYTLVATSSGLISSTSNPFAISAGAAANLAITGGNGQTQTVSTLLPTALTVKVTDASANVVSGTSVTFAVTVGGGSLTTTTTTTDVNGLATTTWTLGTLVGAQTVTATSAGLAGSPATFSATGVVAGLRTWTGLASNQWTDVNSWAPLGAPASTDSVVVPSGSTLPVLMTAATVKALTLAPGGVLSLNGGALTVTSSLDATGSIVVAGATGSVTLTSATGAAVKGVVSNPVTIQGVYTASGSFSASSLVIANGGSLDLNGQPVIVTSGGSFSTTGTGTITMTNISSDLTVSGAATFSGGDETGKLTAGTIGVGGNFSQGGSTPAAFNAGVGSALNLVLSGTVATTLSIANPGNSIMPSVAISNPAGVTATTGFVTKDLLLTTGTLSGTLGATINGTFTDQAGHWAAGNISFATSNSPISALTTSITPASQITFNNNPSILAGPLTVNGAVNALGNLVINGNTLTVNGGLATAGVGGQLTMTNASDVVNVTGDVSFGSTSAGGPMTAGTLNIGGNFSQTGSPQSITTSGTNTLVFNGAGTQTVIFSSPDGNFAGGACVGTACVQNLTVNKTAGQLNFLTTTKVQGNFLNNSTTPVQTPVSNGAFIVLGNAQFGQNGTFYHVGVGSTTFSKGVGTTIDSVTYFGAGQAYNPATLGEQLYSDIRGTANWTAPGTLPGKMVVDGSGQLNVATSGAVVSGSFTTSGTGTLRMTTNPTDSLVIGDSATFGGGATTGLLTTGNIVIGGSTVTMTGLAFDASGAQTTTFNGTTGTQTLNWISPAAAHGYNNITLRGGAQRQFSGNQTILGNMLIDPTSGHVNGSVVLTFAGNITDQTPAQNAWNGSSLAVMTGSPTVLPRNFGVNTLKFSGGTVSLNDSLKTGFLVVDGASAHLKLNGHYVGLTADFTTQNGGVLEMTNTHDTLDIGGTATFNGGNTSGLLTHGFINVGSIGFFQGVNATAFVADSTLRVSIGRGNGTTITFANPGFGTSLSHFGELMIGDGSTHTLGSDVYVQGQLTTQSGPQFPITGNNHLITAQGANASHLFLTNARLLLVDGSPISTLTDLRFSSMDPTLTQLEVQRSGTTGTGDFAATLSAPTFSTLPSSGAYIKATDTNGSAPFLTINVSLPNPPGSTNALFLPVVSGAIINGWPLVATATAIKSGFWSDNTVWSTNVVPAIVDNVVIPSPFAVTVSTSSNAHNLTINSGGSLSLTNNLSLSGAPVNNGTTTCSADNVIVGGNTTLTGTWCGIRSTGTVTLSSSTTVTGVLNIPSGALIVGGNPLTVGSLSTQSSGVLQMTSANDVVTVNGPASFNGGTETGLLTAGTLNVLGDFSGGNGTTFDASGTHTTQFEGSVAQNIGWATPAPNVGFKNVIFSHSQPRQFTSDVFIGGPVTIFSNDTVSQVSGTAFISGAHRVTLGGTNTGVLDQSLGGAWRVGATNYAMPGASLAIFTGSFSLVDTTIFSGGGTFTLPPGVASKFVLTTRNVVVDNSTNLNLNGGLLNTQGKSFITQNGATLQMSAFSNDSLDAGHVYFNGGSTASTLLGGGMAVTGLYQGFTPAFATVPTASPLAFAPAAGLHTYFTGTTPDTVAFANPGTGGAGSHFYFLQNRISGATPPAVVLRSDIFVDSLLLGDVNNATYNSDALGTTVRAINTNGLSNSGTTSITFGSTTVQLNQSNVISSFANSFVWNNFPAGFTGFLYTQNRTTAGPGVGFSNYSTVTFSGAGAFVRNLGTASWTLGGSNTPATCNLVLLSALTGTCK